VFVTFGSSSGHLMPASPASGDRRSWRQLRGDRGDGAQVSTNSGIGHEPGGLPQEQACALGSAGREWQSS